MKKIHITRKNTYLFILLNLLIFVGSLIATKKIHPMSVTGNNIMNFLLGELYWYIAGALCILNVVMLGFTIKTDIKNRKIFASIIDIVVMIPFLIDMIFVIKIVSNLIF